MRFKGVVVAGKINRNAPCPCGSGKKYKKCCWLEERRRSSTRAANRDVMQEAVNWIALQHGDAMNSWIEGVWFEGLSDMERQGLATAEPAMRSIHDKNIMECMVAEGIFREDDQEVPVLRLILDNAPGIEAEQKAYLEQLGDRPLRLYQVDHCTPGDGFSVQLYGDSDGESVFIEEKWASRMLEPGDVVGLRLVQACGAWETTGAVYYIPAEYVRTVANDVMAADNAQQSRVLIRHWLGLVAAHV